MIEIIGELKEIYNTIQPDITNRLSEFREIFKKADNNKIFEELSFCILSSGVGPVMAQNSIDAIGACLHTGNISEVTSSLWLRFINIRTKQLILSPRGNILNPNLITI